MPSSKRLLVLDSRSSIVHLFDLTQLDHSLSFPLMAESVILNPDLPLLAAKSCSCYSYNHSFSTLLLISEAKQLQIFSIAGTELKEEESVIVSGEIRAWKWVNSSTIVYLTDGAVYKWIPQQSIIQHTSSLCLF